MSLSLVLTAGALAGAATVVWLRWVRALRREEGLHEWLDAARRALDTTYAFRTLRGADAEWIAMLDAATPSVEPLARKIVQLGDIAVTHDEAIEGAIRSFVTEDRRMVLFITCHGDTPPVIGFASYTHDARYLTVRTEWWPSRAPISHVRHVAADAAMTDLLDAHIAHTAAEALVAVSTVDDFVSQLARMEHLEGEWRRAQSEDELFERDLKTLVGDEYEEVRGRLHQRPLAVPRARATKLGRVWRRPRR